MKNLKHIDEYKELRNNDDLPLLSDNISDIPCKHKDIILAYLKQDKYIKGAMPAIGYDCFTGEHLSLECLVYTDGEYFWDYETIYYFEKYNMNLPDEFISHVKETSNGR